MLVGCSQRNGPGAVHGVIFGLDLRSCLFFALRFSRH